MYVKKKREHFNVCMHRRSCITTWNHRHL